MLKKKIILASSSPRRKEILEKFGFDFEVVPSDFDEKIKNLEFSYKKIEELAYNKAKAVFEVLKTNHNYYNHIIIGADTVVILDGKIMCKPQDSDDAVRMLSLLSGKRHSVVTSVCAIELENQNKKILSSTSYVEFELLKDSQIKNYVATFLPLDKAGSYGIQELPEGFIKNVEGSYENIMGLCPIIVNKLISEIN